VWNALLAGIVFQHPSRASLMRELGRNGELREECGFDPAWGEKAVPPKWVWTRFFKKLRRHARQVSDLFNTVLEMALKELPDLGESVAIDGKAIPTANRKDPDADWGKKAKTAVKRDGRVEERVVKWFGFKLHLLVDTKYELPLAFELTRASVAETTRMMPMIERLKKTHPKLYARIQELLGDRGYDDGNDKKKLYDEHEIVPLIDARQLHKERQPLNPEQSDTIYFTPDGCVCCKVDPLNPDPRRQYAPMYFMGFEKTRMTLKFRCPAKTPGVTCNNREACRCGPLVRDGRYGRIVRVPLERDRRLFFPVYRHSKKFKRLYRKRTSVERGNSRIDQVYGFEHHYVHGKADMELRMTLTLTVMLATAVAWVRAGKKENVRSLLRAA
jgi:hypothetical protein